jgi:hypothetical protein
MGAVVALNKYGVPRIPECLFVHQPKCPKALDARYNDKVTVYHRLWIQLLLSDFFPFGYRLATSLREWKNRGIHPFYT